MNNPLPSRGNLTRAAPLSTGDYPAITTTIGTPHGEIERIAPACLAEWSLMITATKLAEWSLTINATKTERASRHADRIGEEWRMTRKLGSLLGEDEDVARRKHLTNVAFDKLWTVWLRRSQMCLQLWIRLCESFVMPVKQHGNMGSDEIRARTSGRVPPSLPTPDCQHPLATPYIDRATLYHRCQKRALVF